MLLSFLKTLTKKEMARPLGRWGVTHDQAIKLFATNNYYDHSFSTEENNIKYCKFYIGETVTYCKKCFKMVNKNILNHKDSKFNLGYLEEENCFNPLKKK